MNIEAALVEEQGVTFVVVPVKPHVFDSNAQRAAMAQSLQRYWPNANVVLMVHRTGGRVEYWGRNDIARFLSRVSTTALPWRRWSMH